jgi:pimeloyl-ACP methyl ester carboxylesterase
MEALHGDSKRVELTIDRDDGGSGETTVRYLEAGEGPPVVLLHGVGLDAAAVSWKHAIPELADEFRVLAPDLPGHGESDKPRIRYTTEYFIEAFREFVSELGLSAVRLAGISMGGGVALGYALEHDVEQLVLVDSYGLGADAVWRPMAATALRMPVLDQFVWNTMGVNEGTVRDALRGYVTQASEEFVTELHEVLQDDDCGRTLRSWQRSEFRACGFRTNYRDALPELSVPTLLVHGADDTLLPARWSEKAADRLPDSELHVLSECGHWPPRERPETFHRLLTDFLAA